jgi:hypothetical protein
LYLRPAYLPDNPSQANLIGGLMVGAGGALVALARSELDLGKEWS